jgi:hypothetical protein
MIDSWQRFWFQSEETSTLALVRVAFGLVVIGWTLALLPDLSALFGSSGILPSEPGGPGTWGLMAVLPQHAALIVCAGALLVSSACLLVGYHTRLAAVLVFAGLVSFQRRNPFVFDSGDALLRIIALFLAVSPAGASLSIDRLRTARERFWEFPSRAVWPLRLMQIQLSVIYLATVWTKARGTAWNHGTAVSYALRLRDLNRFPVPHFLTNSTLISSLVTYGTLATELAIGVLVWNRRARPWVLGLGVALHLGIEYSIRVGFLTLGMLVIYVAFVPSDTAARLILAAREELARVRSLAAGLTLRGARRPQAGVR